MISVIMSVYNAEKYLAESIESILNQTYLNFEFIIINDKSSDKSLDIIKKYQSIDDRLVLINNDENLGLTKNLNKAIKVSKGDFIARMDADDISESNRFEKQIIFLNKNPEIGVLGTCAIDIDETGNLLGERDVPLSHKEILNKIHKVNPICHPSVMFRKELVQDINWYNENYKVVQDYDLWFRCAANNITLQNLKERLLRYRVNDNYHSRKSLKYRITDFKIRKNGYRIMNLPIQKRIYSLVPFLLGVVPSFLYRILKKYDPR